MRCLIYTLILLALLTVFGTTACRDRQVVITPAPIEALLEYILSQTWTIIIDGVEYVFDFQDWLKDNQGMNLFGPDPSNLSAEQIRAILVENISETIFNEHRPSYAYRDATVIVNGVIYENIGLKAMVRDYFTDEDLYQIIQAVERSGT